MLRTPHYHFTINSQSNLMADVDLWEPAKEGVFEKGHIHSYNEILIFKKGGGTHQMADELYAVKDYSIHILPGNTFHELKRTTDTDGFEIIFSLGFLNQLQEFDKQTKYLSYFSEARVHNFSKEEFLEFEIYFDQLIKHKAIKPLFYNWVAMVLLKIIQSDGEVIIGSRNTNFERNLLQLLNKHYKEKQPVEFYASNMNMSSITFQRHTKSAFGKSIIELQNEKIIQEVKYLLSQSPKSIREILLEFNFSDESHFTHFFRKHVGITPSAYRKIAMS